MQRIEVIVIGKDKKLFSVAAVSVSKKGDVYLAYKCKDIPSFHVSRHSSGKRHVKSKLFYEKIPLGVMPPIAEFMGIESLGGQAFGIDSLLELYSEYQLKRCDGIFMIDMRSYKGKKFNLQTFILTKEGLNDLYNHTLLKNRQIYLFVESIPMIAIVAGIFNEKYDPNATGNEKPL